jgi:type II secretory pathway component PulC
MLKGLLTRQVFGAVDVALVALIVVVGVLVARELLKTAPAPPPPPDVSGEAAALERRPVGPRPEYDIILANELFGEAGKIPVEPVKAPEPEVVPTSEPVEENRDLKLLGTTLTKPYPNALITRLDTGQTQVYWPGDEIIEGRVKLTEVQDRSVLLINLRENQTEILRIDPEQGAAPAAMAAAAPTPPPPTRVSPNAIQIPKEEISQELATLTEQLPDLVNTLNPRQYKDASGKVVGLTADNISSVPLARRMGLQNNDVVTQINGINIDSQDKITEVIGKFANSDTFHIRVLRQGKPVLLQYRITE